MKGCKALQVLFGFVCAILTIVLGSITLLYFLPAVVGLIPGASVVANDIAQLISGGVSAVAQALTLVGLDWVVACVVFALPTLLLLIGTNLLLYGKRGGSIKAGATLACLSAIIVCGVGIYFRAQMLGDYQQIGLIVLASVLGFVLLLAIITSAVVNELNKTTSKPAAVAVVDEGTTNTTVDTVDDQPVETANTTTEQVDDVAVDTPVEQPVEEPAAEQPVVAEIANDTPAEQPAEQTDDGILFMAQDYSSVSEASDETYEHTEVLTQKVLDKLKIARELYIKGVITKDEYLAIVNKYLSQE